MTLPKPPFYLYATGFVHALTINQLINISVSQQTWITKFLVMCSFMTATIQCTVNWAEVNGVPFEAANTVMAISTFFGNGMLVGMVYVSLKRFDAICFGNPWILKFGQPLLVLVFVIRKVRTVFIFMNGPDAAIPVIITVITMVPLLILRALMDSVSLYKIWDMRGKSTTDRHKQKAFQKIIYSLTFENVLTLCVIVFTLMDFLKSTADKPFVFEFLLASWSISAMTEQRKLYQTIFGIDVESSGNTNPTNLKTNPVNATGPSIPSITNTKGGNVNVFETKT
ncbi:hypothetical protein BC833DRAFT_604647 [Globomyces pollinis-pini]|nr:hypothetical protein BC833DRAFT_604647 [Globomyces pollinis-pini]